MGCHNYWTGLFEIQVKLLKKLGTYNPSDFQCRALAMNKCYEFQLIIMHWVTLSFTTYRYRYFYSAHTCVTSVAKNSSKLSSGQVMTDSYIHKYASRYACVKV